MVEQIKAGGEIIKISELQQTLTTLERLAKKLANIANNKHRRVILSSK